MPDSIPELDPGLAAFAASLRQVLPSAPQIRTDEVIFEAGRSSVSPRYQYLWQGVAAGFAVLSVGLAYQLLDRPVRTVTVERSVPVEHVVAIGDTATSIPVAEAPPAPGANPTPEAVPVYPYGPSPTPEVPVLRRGSIWDGLFTTSHRPAPRSPLLKQQDRIRKVGDLPAMPAMSASMPGLPPDPGSDDDLGLPSLPGGILGSPTRRH